MDLIQLSISVTKKLKRLFPEKTFEIAAEHYNRSQGGARLSVIIPVSKGRTKSIVQTAIGRRIFKMKDAANGFAGKLVTALRKLDW